MTLLGLALIVIPFTHIILMKSLRDGIFYIMLLNVAVMINDVAAYFGGVFFGKHKIKFPVSPNKSWEGYSFALFFCVLSTIIFSQFCLIFYGRDIFSLPEAVIAGILISLGAAIGDLVESAAKRDGGIKNSGSIVPGHGGMWDVFDAIIFTMPLFYYYIVFCKDIH
ncbi:MAG: phosphatidate cytidylyltransferase [Leptospirales bacterium]|nr:phosphatidate cytidylyltransferase [Leptospirales bacterium]